ncbi:cobalt-precorrin-6A reductase [Terasakiella sp. A23]|uniref:cobalt-precorrin-6A reductase n=1 Tax=Terasakiella sp. FCG-A23 TaxID=3080561 RepID=UPI0029531F19|nr:cobalt-precorrin-6A reductase [Terasakiella sp. A23]MDV7338428.1 cobalt-precorrin-6A reductase [Terasakiella sp. A23]
MPAKKLLILGGTGEAAKLAKLVMDCFQDRLDVTVSYSGVTGHQPELPCNVRVGGFGGVEGMMTYIRENKIDYLVDATHPFAEKISQHAYIVANAMQLPIIVFKRPQWVAQPKDKWLEVNDMDQAVEVLSQLGATAFLTTGVKDLHRFEGLDDVQLIVRLVNEPKEELPLANYKTVIGRPPFSVEEEIQLIRDHKIRVLVTKNSGGEQTSAKLEAARQEKISVIMINRPPAEPLEETGQINDVLKWLNAHGA